MKLLEPFEHFESYEPYKPFKHFKHFETFELFEPFGSLWNFKPYEHLGLHNSQSLQEASAFVNDSFFWSFYLRNGTCTLTDI